MFMNHSDIDEAVDRLTRFRSPVLPYAIYLRDWRDIVNANSDGWAYWPGGARAAKRLQELVQQEVEHQRWFMSNRDHGSPLFSHLNRALTPIKACATRRRLPVPTFTRTEATR